tara:strand:- start:2425 stop:2526 length:102 start_codon:yes stop_codon:yes gene_type:complete
VTPFDWMICGLLDGPGAGYQMSESEKKKLLKGE